MPKIASIVSPSKIRSRTTVAKEAVREVRADELAGPSREHVVGHEADHQVGHQRPRRNALHRREKVVPAQPPREIAGDEDREGDHDPAVIRLHERRAERRPVGLAEEKEQARGRDREADPYPFRPKRAARRRGRHDRCGGL
jgi:hypothetical protein